MINRVRKDTWSEAYAQYRILELDNGQIRDLALETYNRINEINNISMLTQYLTHPNSAVREWAENRYRELKKSRVFEKGI